MVQIIMYVKILHVINVGIPDALNTKMTIIPLARGFVLPALSVVQDCMMASIDTIQIILALSLVEYVVKAKP
jgi:hypothetical protein